MNGPERFGPLSLISPASMAAMSTLLMRAVHEHIIADVLHAVDEAFGVFEIGQRGHKLTEDSGRTEIVGLPSMMSEFIYLISG